MAKLPTLGCSLDSLYWICLLDAMDILSFLSCNQIVTLELICPLSAMDDVCSCSLCPPDRIPSTTPGAEPPRDAKDSGSARSHSTHLETSSSDRP